MKNWVWILVVLLTGRTVFAQTEDERLINAAFDQYKMAVLMDNGEEALKWVDTRTIAYYDTMLWMTRYADSATLAKGTTLDLLMVLTMRHRTPAEQLRSFDGKSLFVYAVEKGMVSKSSVQENTLGTIQVTGDFATSTIVNNGEETPIKFEFYRNEGKWQVDLTSIFMVGNIALNQYIEQLGMTRTDFIIYALVTSTGTELSPDIWKPVN